MTLLSPCKSESSNIESEMSDDVLLVAQVTERREIGSKFGWKSRQPLRRHLQTSGPAVDR